MSWQKAQAGTVLIAVALCAGLPAIGAGCGLAPYDCADWAECPPEGPACPGQCIPLPPLDFNGPALLWVGSELEAPECPARAPVQVYEGRAELNTSNLCPTCACAPPACQLPAGLTASDSPMCQGPGFIDFDAPAGWSGTCTSPAVVPSSDLASLAFEPVTERPCEPLPANEPVPFEKPWGKYARACGGEAITNVCGDPGLTCLPTAEPPPPGFQQCIMYTREDDPKCPTSYPEKLVFYGGMSDTRDCTPCECAQTAPSQCVASMSLYQQTNCTSFIDAYPLGLGMPGCNDIMVPLVQLGSMSATWLTNVPGACAASGGQPIGEVKPANARTFCCQPPPG